MFLELVIGLQKYNNDLGGVSFGTDDDGNITININGQDTLLKKKAEYSCTGTVTFYCTSSTTKYVTFGTEFIVPPAVTTKITVNEDSKFGSSTASSVTTIGCNITAYMKENTAHNRNCTVEYTATGWIWNW